LLAIRLTRTGTTKKPSYRVVVIEKQRARDGRPVETVGFYNPRTQPATVSLKRDRIEYWISKGAQPSDTVRGLLRASAPAA
jgi:small subunit ribosomal protein S16